MGRDGQLEPGFRRGRGHRRDPDPEERPLERQPAFDRRSVDAVLVDNQPLSGHINELGDILIIDLLIVYIDQRVYLLANRPGIPASRFLEPLLYGLLHPIVGDQTSDDPQFDRHQFIGVHDGSRVRASLLQVESTHVDIKKVPRADPGTVQNQQGPLPLQRFRDLNACDTPGIGGEGR